MPLYDYKCPDCGREVERVVTLAARDAQFCHQQNNTETAECGAQLARVEISSGQIGLTDRRWKYDAILNNGQRVDGATLGRSRKHKGFM